MIWCCKTKGENLQGVKYPKHRARQQAHTQHQTQYYRFEVGRFSVPFLRSLRKLLGCVSGFFVLIIIKHRRNNEDADISTSAVLLDTSTLLRQWMAVCPTIPEE